MSHTPYAVVADGEAHEFEVAGFGIVEEWRQVADLETYNLRRQQTGEAALEHEPRLGPVRDRQR